MNSLDNIGEYEERLKGTLLSYGYHFVGESKSFTLPYPKVEKVAGELEEQGKFYGPIYQSTMNFLKALKDYKEVE